MRYIWSLLVSLLVILVWPPSVEAAGTACTLDGDVKALPDVMGYGAMTVGGRGGLVFPVTNLNDAGPGSLRACVEADGPRVCVFGLGGTIVIDSPLVIANPYITIAGQTAPADSGGITIKHGGNVTDATVKIAANEVILQNIRVRSGASQDKTSSLQALSIGTPRRPVRNVVVDHGSFSWSTDQTVTTWFDTQNVTIAYSIISEGLHCSTHEKTEGRTGCHSKGLHLGDSQGGRISVYGNLLVHNAERNPSVVTGRDLPVEFVNNVIYGAGQYTVFRNNYGAVPSLDVIGNVYKQQATPRISEVYYLVAGDWTEDGIRLFVKDNLGWSRPSGTELDALSVKEESRRFLVSNRLANPVVEVVPEPVETVFEDVLANAGARRPALDAVDERIVYETRNGTGRVIDDPSQVGGWPELAAGMAPVDTDNDWLPDAWELEYFDDLTVTGLDADGRATVNTDADGYTDFEEYLNQTNPAVRESGCAMVRGSENGWVNVLEWMRNWGGDLKMGLVK